jgi:hypothetical protein
MNAASTVGTVEWNDAPVGASSRPSGVAWSVTWRGFMSATLSAGSACSPTTTVAGARTSRRRGLVHRTRC